MRNLAFEKGRACVEAGRPLKGSNPYLKPLPRAAFVRGYHSVPLVRASDRLVVTRYVPGAIRLPQPTVTK